MVLYGLALTPLAETIRARVPTSPSHGTRTTRPWQAQSTASPKHSASFSTRSRRDTSRAGQVDPHRPARHPAHRPRIPRGIQLPTRGRAPLPGRLRGIGRRRGGMGGPQVQQWIECPLPRGGGEEYPQTAYAGLSQSLQSEWQYLQRVTPDIAPAFAPLEAAIATVFLPASRRVGRGGRQTPPLLALPTRLGGLGIPDPTTTGRSASPSTASTNLLHCSWWRAPLCCSAQARRLHRSPRGEGAPAPRHGAASRDPRRLATDGEAAHHPVGGDRRVALHPAEPPQRLRPLGRGVPRWRPPSLGLTPPPPTPMRRMRRTLHDGARHVLSQRG
ncbi:hypothetical protein MHU86_8393 [Fragilaria crotonensis]|nr:hypothetical protein MHU86_8393 [Fragilaria crotonensis]